MAGHSKWANIKFRKAAQDQKRGKIFTKLIRELTIAARQGGGDPDANPRLRLAIDKANSKNMPKANLEKAIKKGTGELAGDALDEILYEGYGPGGVAVMVECMTDNRNRTVAEVRHAFSKCGGNLGTDGSVAYLFHKRGIISFPATSDEDHIMDIALGSEADDVITHDDGSIDVLTSLAHFITVKEALIAEIGEPEQADLTMVASTEVTLDKDGAEKMMRLLDMLEDLDDVQEVYSNANIPDDVLAELGG